MSNNKFAQNVIFVKSMFTELDVTQNRRKSRMSRQAKRLSRTRHDDMVAGVGKYALTLSLIVAEYFLTNFVV